MGGVYHVISRGALPRLQPTQPNHQSRPVFVAGPLPMTYHLARYTPEELISIREFNSYQEADDWHEHYCHIYDHSWVEIVSDQELQQANAN
jgi:hypothetical protein